MPYVENSGVRIHYHVEGEGPPLVLQHGLTSSPQNWYAYGFVEELQKDYRLILVATCIKTRKGVLNWL